MNLSNAVKSLLPDESIFIPRTLEPERHEKRVKDSSKWQIRDNAAPVGGVFYDTSIGWGVGHFHGYVTYYGDRVTICHFKDHILLKVNRLIRLRLYSDRVEGLRNFQPYEIDPKIPTKVKAFLYMMR